MANEDLFTFFQRDTVNNTLTLQTFQARKDDVPVRRVNHDGYGGDVGLCSDGVKKIHHLRLRIQQTVVHVHVDDQRTVSHLFAGNADGLVVLFLLYQSEEFARACDITTLTHIDEVYFRGDVEQFQTTQPHGVRFGSRLVGCLALSQRNIFSDEFVGGTTTATHNVYQSLVNHLANLRRHRLSSLVVESHGIGQACIRIGTNIIRCLTSQLAQERQHLACTKRAVQAHGEDGIAADARQKGVECLSTQRTTSQIADGSTQHDGHLATTLLHGYQRGIDGHLCIQTVEDGLYQQCIYTTLQQAVSLFKISVKQLVIGQFTQGGVADIGRHRARLVGRTDRASHKAGLV